MTHNKVDHRKKLAPDHSAPKADTPEPFRLRGVLNKLGPGLVTGASDDDPSGIGTYSQAGAQLGYGIGWTMLFTFPLMVAIQEISARVGRVTGLGIAGNVCRHYPAWLLNIVVVLLFAANTINIRRPCFRDWVPQRKNIMIPVGRAKRTRTSFSTRAFQPEEGR